MSNDSMLTPEITNAALTAGVRQMQGVLAGTDLTHAAALLGMMNPGHGAQVVDAGCGVGETARLMREIRRDLRFTLVNRDEYQLSLCPNGTETLLADYHNMPLADGSVGVVMFCYAAVHSNNWPALMAEAFRVLASGGVLLMHEPVDLGDADTTLWSGIGGNLRTMAGIMGDAVDAGFTPTLVCPVHGAEQFHRLTNPEMAIALWDGAGSFVFRFTKP